MTCISSAGRAAWIRNLLLLKAGLRLNCGSSHAAKFTSSVKTIRQVQSAARPTQNHIWRKITTQRKREANCAVVAMPLTYLSFSQCKHCGPGADSRFLESRKTTAAWMLTASVKQNFCHWEATKPQHFLDGTKPFHICL